MNNIEKEDYTILVVDDDPEVLSVIVEGLEFRGLTVYHTQTAEKALELQQIHQVKHFLLDLNLDSEKWNGISLGKSLTANDPEISIMIMTGYPDMEVMLPIIRRERFGYLMKPFRLEQVLIWLDQCRYLQEVTIENQTLRTELKAATAEVEELRKQLEDQESGSSHPRISTLDPIKGQKSNRYLIDSYKKNSR